jgi:hypothetical protein
LRTYVYWNFFLATVFVVASVVAGAYQGLWAALALSCATLSKCYIAYWAGKFLPFLPKRMLVEAMSLDQMGTPAGTMDNLAG